jgi:GTP-binding protein
MAVRSQPLASGLPVVAIVGRPNVGKSSLFNRIVRAHRAIVDDTPGVTRDRVIAPASYDGKAFLCVDTGGFDADPAADAEAPSTNTLDGRVREQALAALREADCAICVLDGRAGLAPADAELVRLLRKSRTPVVYAVNKIDTAKREELVGDFYATGVETIYPVSAAHGLGLDALLDAVATKLPETSETPAPQSGARLALMGRPNVGKSSLLNQLLGTERAVVSPVAGTTRDSIDTPVLLDGRPYVLIDTAGVRRRMRVTDRLERHGAVRALGTIARTDLVLLVLDASEGLTDQDARLAARAWEAGRGLILVANKWDLLAGRARDVARFRREVASLRPGFERLPLLCTSAHTGEGLEGVLGAVRRVERAYDATLPTAALNRALQDAIAATAPPSPGGRAIRLFYATQTARRPPEVTVFASAPQRVPESYRRYLTSRIVGAFDLAGVPLGLKLRSRRDESVTPRRDSAPAAKRTSPRPRARARARRR